VGLLPSGSSPTSHLEAPLLERGDSLLERSSLIRPRRRPEQASVGSDSDLQSAAIALRRGEARRVVGEVRLCQLVRRKTLDHVSPAIDAIAQAGLAQSPKMPGTTVCRVGRNRSIGQRFDRVRATSRQPIRVGKAH